MLRLCSIPNASNSNEGILQIITKDHINIFGGHQIHFMGVLQFTSSPLLHYNTYQSPCESFHDMVFVGHGLSHVLATVLATKINNILFNKWKYNGL